MGGERIPARSSPTCFHGCWGIGRHGLYFSHFFLRKTSSILARFADSSRWRGILGYFVPCVAVAPAESSLNGRMDEQDGLMVIVQLKGKLESEVPGLGGQEEKQTMTVCPRPAGKFCQSKWQGQIRERSFVAENL